MRLIIIFIDGIRGPGACQIWVKLALLLGFGLVSACSTKDFSLADRAALESLFHQPARTAAYEHSVYKKSGPTDYQVVFIEGDGRPWTADGREPARDPSPRDALAFDLFMSTPAEAYYVTRPCYFETWAPDCSSATWTSARYSQAVVESLGEAIHMTTDSSQPLVLVGYSGGGALVILLAQELESVIGVVTIAGLLDTDRWTDHHGYEPLDGSINPAARTPGVPQLHLHGTADTVVPIEHVRDTVASWPGATLLEYDEYGHVCCWRRDWSPLWREVETAFGLGVYEQSDSTRDSQ